MDRNDIKKIIKEIIKNPFEGEKIINNTRVIYIAEGEYYHITCKIDFKPSKKELENFYFETKGIEKIKVENEGIIVIDKEDKQAYFSPMVEVIYKNGGYEKNSVETCIINL